MKDLLEIAIAASLDAGMEIMKIYESDDFEVGFKKDESPLTKADLASHHLILDYLNKTEISVLSEEGKDISYEHRKQWDRLWIVDPIDGTKEFIKKNGEFTVNIALIENQEPILGVIYVPALKDLYFASKDTGCYLAKGVDVNNSIQDVWKVADKLPMVSDSKIYTIVASKSHLSKETEEFIKKIQLEKGEVKTLSKGSSLKLCMVAEGKADCYPRFAPTMEWDTAAGHAICKYAGKSVIDMDTGKEMLYNREKLLNNWFIVQ